MKFHAFNSPCVSRSGTRPKNGNTGAMLFIAASFILAIPVSGQIKPVTVPRIEPGLELAIQWKWRVVPSEGKEWGLPPPEPEPETVARAIVSGGAANPSEPRPTEYEVKKGDALILIGKKFGMTPQQLKSFNGLTTDTIRIGQVLKIPTLEELKAMAPPPEPEKKPKEEDKTGTPKAQPVEQASGQEDLLLQVFLDRELFSTGPIDGNPGPLFEAVSKLYRDSHEDAQNIDTFRKKARDTVKDPLTHYALKPEDFRFIAVAENKPGAAGKKKSQKSGKASTGAPPTYAELIAAPWLAYRTPWEFVAERFHCDETFLRGLNPRIKGNPVAGAIFLVPNVTPFEIEKALEAPLQPEPDPQIPVTASIVDLSRLEIVSNGKLVAVMPLALARPDLRGRGAWSILDAIPRPRLATSRELKDAPKTDPAPAAGPGASQQPVPTAPPATASPSREEYLESGPNNPVGVVWINLAKAKSTEALPYGLHGTSIPARMKTQEGIGGIRLANWDIVRAVRLLPRGSPIQWK